MAKARKYVLRSHFSGLPKREDLEIVEEELPALQDGGQPTKPTRNRCIGDICCMHTISDRLHSSLSSRHTYNSAATAVFQAGGSIYWHAQHVCVSEPS